MQTMPEAVAWSNESSLSDADTRDNLCVKTWPSALQILQYPITGMFAIYCSPRYN